MNRRAALNLQLVDDEIIVTLPGSTYTVTYYKLPSSPQLFAKRVSETTDSRAGMSVHEFLAGAWQQANDKARELGWIV